MLLCRLIRRRRTPPQHTRMFLTTFNNSEEKRKKSSVSIDPIQNKDYEKFLATLPDIVSNITSSNKLPSQELRPWVEKLILYNSTGGKKTRGLMTVCAYQMLEKPENITEETMRKARFLGWCVELLQTAFLIMDDVMDGSSTRRGQACWYRLPDVGMRAVNDAGYFISLMFEILKSNFSGQLDYASLVNVFYEAILQISTGQYLDFTSKRNFSVFNEKNYNNIAIFKTMFYTYKLPIYASLLLANRCIENVFQSMDCTLNQMGLLTMMQNDFMDCYGDEAVVGKVGTDIQEGKCTWLAVTALQRFNAAQRADFEAHYGSADEAHVKRVKQLYRDVQLPALYYATEQAAFDKIARRVEDLSADNEIPSALYLKLFNMVFRLWDTQQCNFSIV